MQNKNAKSVSPQAAPRGERQNPALSQRWFHIIISTYGSWLFGDPRGFRTRHHRLHVEGDYKNPPPLGKYDDLEKQSRESMNHDEVFLPYAFREIVGKAVKEKLESLGSLVIAIAAA